MAIWIDQGVTVVGENGEFLFSANPVRFQAQITQEHAAVEWARQELQNYKDLPSLGATCDEEYLEARGRVSALKDILHLADGIKPRPLGEVLEELRPGVSRRNWPAWAGEYKREPYEK